MIHKISECAAIGFANKNPDNLVNPVKKQVHSERGGVYRHGNCLISPLRIWRVPLLTNPSTKGGSDL